MLSTQKRISAIILILCMALSLLLTACSNSGNTPTGDNSTPGVSGTETSSGTPGATDTTPVDTTAPDDTPNETETSTPDTSEPPNNIPKLDPSNYDMEKKAGVDESIEYYGELFNVDIDALISEAFEEYESFIDENITPDVVRIAIATGRHVDGIARRDSRSLSCLPESSLQKVNDHLNDVGPLDAKDPKQDIVSLAIALTLNYETNVEGLGNPVFDLAYAFGYTYSGEGADFQYCASSFNSMNYFGL